METGCESIFLEWRSPPQFKRGWAAVAGKVDGEADREVEVEFDIQEVAGEVDFISIGTNDLLQFFNAADRMVPAVSERYDIVSRPVMRFLDFIKSECDKYEIPVSVCGEVASRPVEALCLLGLGFRSLSMPAAGIGPVKRMLRSVDLAGFTEPFLDAIRTSNGPFRNEVLAIARVQGIAVSDG